MMVVGIRILIGVSMVANIAYAWGGSHGDDKVSEFGGAVLADVGDYVCSVGCGQ